MSIYIVTRQVDRKYEELYVGSDGSEAIKIAKDVSKEPCSSMVELRTYTPFTDTGGVGFSTSSFEKGKSVRRTHLLTKKDLEILTKCFDDPEKFENLSSEEKAELKRQEKRLCEEWEIEQEFRRGRN